MIPINSIFIFEKYYQFYGLKEYMIKLPLDARNLQFMTGVHELL